MARCQRLDMWFTLVVLGVMVYLWACDKLRGLAPSVGARFNMSGLNDIDVVDGQVVVRGTPKPVPQTRADAPSPFSAWWPSVVKHDGHIMIVGETRNGKSTTARALLAARARTDAIVIIAPHAKFAAWHGLTAVGEGRDFAAVADALYTVHAEFERRCKPGEAIGDPLTIIIDEYPAIVVARPEVAVLVKSWLREAAAAKIRLVFLVQDPSVETLGIEGEGEVRQNVWSILLGSFAVKVSEVAALQERPAVLQRFMLTHAVSVAGLPYLAEVALHPSVMWRFAVPVAAEPEGEKLLELAVGTGTGEPVPVEPIVVGEKRVAAIRRAKAASLSSNDIAAMIGGDRAAALEMIRQALGEGE